MLFFFKNIEVAIHGNHEIYLNLSNVINITTDAILYTLSRIDHYKHIYTNLKIGGNSPLDIGSRAKLEDSGFFGFVYSKSRLKTKNNDIYKIKSLENVDPTVAKEIVDFSKIHSSTENPLDFKSVYATLIECMANTQNHAYEKDHEFTKIYSKWWLMAEHNKNNNETNFVFLDNGYGIPKTIRKNFKEKIKSNLLHLKNVDSELILSCLHGDFRTKTGLKHRGKGLPRIYSFSKTGMIKNLKIISKKGM